MTVQPRPIVRKKRKRRKNKLRRMFVFILIIVCLFIFLHFLFQFDRVRQGIDYIKGQVNPKVSALQPTIEEYASNYGIEEYVPYLLAIIEVESGGKSEDIMQASESLGLEPNSLSKEESIKQGVNYFAHLIKLASKHGCDVKTAVQAYNYGPNFIYFVSERGGAYTDNLAEEFAKDYSGGKQVTYISPISVLSNGGWRYDYGNMFYMRLVEHFM